MAIEKVINIVANAKQAAGEIKDLFNTMLEAEIQQQKLNAAGEEMGEAYKDGSKEAEKSLNKVEKSAENQSRAMKTLKGAIGAVGTAFKALGIGIVVAAVAKLTQVLSENQKVVDAVSTISTTFSIVINQLFESFSKIATKISEATGGFNALGEVVGSVVKLAFNNLKIVVLELQAGFTALKLAYEKVFGDDEGVEKAKKDLVEIGNKIKGTLEDNVKQAKNVVSNVGEAIDEVVTGVSILATDGVKAIQEVDVKAAYAQAQAIERNKKNFELLALQQQRIQLQYQFQAEALRQLRDDDTKAISERIKANDELSEVLKKQLASESATIKARIAGLQQEQSLLGVTQERTNEIYQLQTDLIDVAERLKGAESEQLTNKNALLKEQRDLQQTIVDAQTERQIAQLEFEESQLKREDEKLLKQKERLKLENQLILEDLERKRELYAEGTQARVDAEQEYLTKNQEINNQLKQNSLDLFRFYEDEYAKDQAKKKQYEEAKKEAVVSIAGQTMQLVSELAGEGTKLAKGIAVAQATMSGIEGVQNAYTTAQKSPITIGFPAYPYVQAGLAGAFSLLQIRKIMQTSTSGSGGGSSVGGGATAPSAPSFNLVSGTGTNQIAESLATERQPVKAYVVASEMTTQQALENNISSTASIG